MKTIYKEYLKRKEKLIISAIDILEEGGIQALTTKELAKREGITEPAIYKQFDSKRDIMMAILERFAIFDEQIESTIKEQKIESKKAVIYFAETYACYYQSYPQLATVLISYDFFKYEKTTCEKMQNIMKRRYELIKRLIDQGQEKGEIPNDIASEDLSEIILGIIWSAVFKWKMEDYSFSLKEAVMKRLEWVLHKL
ncbi:MAG: TetR/AcrR family transcriptional regulator [Clostridia bacterium]|nr:TetR/AcrR family transcriptional regulator [Clostridia bacterium]